MCVALVRGLVSADTQEEAREKLANREYGEVTDIVLQSLNLMDDLDAVEEDDDD